MLGFGFLVGGADPNQVEVLQWHGSSTVELMIQRMDESIFLNLIILVATARIAERVTNTMS